MAQTSTATIAVTLSTKKIVVTGTIAIREVVLVTLTGTGTAGASDLVLGLVDNGTLLATIAAGDFSGTGPDGIYGDLDLNTEEMVELFSGDVGRTTRKVSICLWDITNNCLLANDTVKVLNNPYTEDMADPTPVTPIGGVEYAPLANGVTNGDSHTHQNGDGGSLDPYYIRRTPTNGSFRTDANGQHLQFYDVVTAKWRTLILANGALTLGPEVS